MNYERVVDPALRTFLKDNEPFQYAHLIKFERPSMPDSVTGEVSTSKERYTYLTDASRDIKFNDNSKTNAGIPNEEQTYIANKVISISNFVESSEAKATTYNITLDGNAIGAYSSNHMTNMIYIDANTFDMQLINPQTTETRRNEDLIELGFREGDKISVNGQDYNIVNFREDNKIRLGRIDFTPSGWTNLSTIIELKSEEITGLITTETYSQQFVPTFLNREVYIYRGYYNSDGAIVGEPFLLFKGIIAGGQLEDEENLEVTWTLTSHWGDFAQVRGRITSDDFHRALDQNGNPQPSSAIRTAYAYDKGFSHSETSVNILASYTVNVEKQDVTVKKGFLGLFSKVKVTKYLVPEERHTELDLQLQAKSIPIVYGIQSTPGVPIFADTLADNSSIVYVAYAISEGEIGGLYDILIDGNSLICNDKADYDSRSTQNSENTVKLICRGRADRGDVLGGTESVDAAQIVEFYDGQEYLYSDISYNKINFTNSPSYVPPAVDVLSDVTGRGVIDSESLMLSSPQAITLDFFSGKPNQIASPALVEIAKNNNFKIQRSYWTGTDTAEYWGPNHRLLDTAYVIVKYTIAEGDTSIPDLQFVVRGKILEGYNYDYSYEAWTPGQNAAPFQLGDTVTIQDMNGNVLNSSVQLVDKWAYPMPDGLIHIRFRFNEAPNLNYVDGVPTITRFRMVKDGNIWMFATYNHIEWSGTVGAEQSIQITGVTAQNDNIQMSLNPNSPGFTSYQSTGLQNTAAYGIALQ